MQTTLVVGAAKDIQLANNCYEVYRPTPTLMFVLVNGKTIVCTPLQTFLIKYDHRNYIKQLKRLTWLIRKNEMKSIPELVSYCDFKPGGYKNQMSGLELVPTKLNRHIW